MKLVPIFALACCVIIISSCNKNVTNSHTLPGTWKETRITGGFAGIDKSPDDDIRLSFETDGKFNVSTNGSISANGNYSLSKAQDPNDYGSETIISFSYSNGGNFINGIKITGNNLFLTEGCCDQFNYTYTRLK